MLPVYGLRRVVRRRCITLEGRGCGRSSTCYGRSGCGWRRVALACSGSSSHFQPQTRPSLPSAMSVAVLDGASAGSLFASSRSGTLPAGRIDSQPATGGASPGAARVPGSGAGRSASSQRSPRTVAFPRHSGGDLGDLDHSEARFVFESLSATGDPRHNLAPAPLDASSGGVRRGRPRRQSSARRARHSNHLRDIHPIATEPRQRFGRTAMLTHLGVPLDGTRVHPDARMQKMVSTCL